jgi:hypothetical protein
LVLHNHSRRELALRDGRRETVGWVGERHGLGDGG